MEGPHFVLTWFPFTVGFVGSLHCVGMCGPLVAAAFLDASGADTPAYRADPKPWAQHAAYHAGRLLSLAVLGTAAAGLFQIADFLQFFTPWRSQATLVAGILLLLCGLGMLRLVPLPSAPSRAAAGPLLGAMARLLRSRRFGTRLLLGATSALIPCCLSWGVLVSAAATADALSGLGTMISFGLGTAPALLVVGLFASRIPVRVRTAGEGVAAFFLLAMGAVLVLRGVGILA